MSTVVLIRTSRVSAEATIERLQGLGIQAELLESPNAIVRLLSGGNYRVGVAVPEADVERARAELARWDEEAQPRLRALAREVRVGFALATLPAVLLTAWFVAHPPHWAWWYSVLVVWLAGVWAWSAWSRPRSARK